MYLSDTLILVRGGGDLGTGVAHRLNRSGFTVMVTELARPLAVRRAVAFAVVDEVPVVVDLDGSVVSRMKPPVVVDARMAKRRLDTRLTDASLVIGLGPGLVAGQDCHAVVETNRGHNLGRVYWEGSAEADTGQPEPVLGAAGERVLRAPAGGVFTGRRQIGDQVHAGDVLGDVAGQPVTAKFDGVLRGLLHDGVAVTQGAKIGDVDPRGVRDFCFTISDKARAIGGGVLEALLAGIEYWRPELRPEERDQGLP